MRVKNSGLGVARKLKIDSAQPRIIENKQGLLVDFKLHGCEFTAYYTHADELGGPLTSLSCWGA